MSVLHESSWLAFVATLRSFLGKFLTRKRRFGECVIQRRQKFEQLLDEEKPIAGVLCRQLQASGGKGSSFGERAPLQHVLMVCLRCFLKVIITEGRPPLQESFWSEVTAVWVAALQRCILGKCKGS